MKLFTGQITDKYLYFNDGVNVFVQGTEQMYYNDIHSVNNQIIKLADNVKIESL